MKIKRWSPAKIWFYLYRSPLVRDERGQPKQRRAYLGYHPSGRRPDRQAEGRDLAAMTLDQFETGALRLLAELLYFKEDFEGRHSPRWRGSHNLAELHAAAEDLHSVARSLAVCAKYIDDELSERERRASRQADRFAIRVSRLAEEIDRAIDEIAPPKKRGS